MEKQDLMYGIAALVIILVIALVIKPMVTGQPVNTGIPVPTTIPPTSNLSVTPFPVRPPVTVTTMVPVPTATPTPVPTWDKNVTKIVFVDPSQYGISMNTSLPGGTRIDNIPVNTSMTTFATISGQYSGTSQIINVPFPYWELWYTVEPAGKTGGKDQAMGVSSITGSKQSGESVGSASVMQGSYSVVIPKFTVQVMDGNDPNRIVRTITPPGGIDMDLWTGSKSVTSVSSGEAQTIPDPRPWRERFFEGERNYYFIINAQSLTSYKMEFKVPTRYVDNSSSGTKK
jgi:hypothetical protein